MLGIGLSDAVLVCKTALSIIPMAGHPVRWTAPLQAAPIDILRAMHSDTAIYVGEAGHFPSRMRVYRGKGDLYAIVAIFNGIRITCYFSDFAHVNILPDSFINPY